MPTRDACLSPGQYSFKVLCELWVVYSPENNPLHDSIHKWNKPPRLMGIRLPLASERLLHQEFLVMDAPQQHQRQGRDTEQGQPGIEDQGNSAVADDDAQIPGMPDVLIRATSDKPCMAAIQIA